MKSLMDEKTSELMGRPPHGGRGLKYLRHATRSISKLSAPTRGPWIEISSGVSSAREQNVGPHTGAVD